MKNLLNCHVKGLHSFPISYENGLYRRIFYADQNHELWKTDPLALAIHPHHVDIKMTVLQGVIFNKRYQVDHHLGFVYQKFIWDSVILSGKGGFKRVGEERLSLVDTDILMPGKPIGFTLQSCVLHTVFVTKGQTAVWLIEESDPSCGYVPYNFSNWDLEKWDQSGLYIEVGDDVKGKMVGKYLKRL